MKFEEGALRRGIRDCLRDPARHRRQHHDGLPAASHVDHDRHDGEDRQKDGAAWRAELCADRVGNRTLAGQEKAEASQCRHDDQYDEKGTRKLPGHWVFLGGPIGLTSGYRPGACRGRFTRR